MRKRHDKWLPAWLTACLRGLVAIAAVVAPVTPVAAGDADSLKRTLEARFPGAVIANVRPSPYFGLYEATIEDRMLYTDDQARYVFVGSVLDAVARTNLTEARLAELNAVDFHALPLDLAIRTVHGNGERQLAVFSDPDCPFCKQLEATLKDVDNVTIYTFLFPLAQLHPDATDKAQAIWCAADRDDAWQTFQRTGTVPARGAGCSAPLEQLADLARRYKVIATPTLVFADGRVVPGALPRARVEAALDAPATHERAASLAEHSPTGESQ